MLEVETLNFKGPRAYDTAGLPLAFDNQSIFKERIYLDKADAKILHDEMTVIDHALTRPWTVDKKYLRNPNPRPLIAARTTGRFRSATSTISSAATAS